MKRSSDLPKVTQMINDKWLSLGMTPQFLGGRGTYATNCLEKGSSGTDFLLAQNIIDDREDFSCPISNNRGVTNGR